MTSEKSHQNKKPLPQKYLRQLDSRTDLEKSLSNRIAHDLSQLNIQRITHNTLAQRNDLVGKFHFVCLAGLPPIQGEFSKLNLPGEITLHTLSGYEKKYTEEEYIKIFKSQSFDMEAERLRSKIELIPAGKKIILLYHSFGSYIASVYFKKYGDHKISGIIDIGGAPITFYPIILNFIKMSSTSTDEGLLENAQFIQKKYEQNSKDSQFITINNKYLTISFMKLMRDINFETMFEDLRHLPKVLKFMAYGKNDFIFTEELLNEKFIHYSYVNKLEPGYEKKCLDAYKDLYGKGVNNIQERFCINFEKGKHSIHLQPKIIPLLQLGILQYLWIIERVTEP